MSDAAQEEPPTRRVRPWIAAVLTYFGWGLGFYYAGHSRQAWLWTLTNVAVVAGIILALIGYVAVTRTMPFPLNDPDHWTPLDTLVVVLTVPVAILAWRTARRERRAPLRGVMRLLGYIAVWLVPIVVSFVLAFGVRALLLQPFRSPSNSMAPSIDAGDYLPSAREATATAATRSRRSKRCFPLDVGARARRREVILSCFAPSPSRGATSSSASLACRVSACRYSPACRT